MLHLHFRMWEKEAGKEEQRITGIRRRDGDRVDGAGILVRSTRCQSRTTTSG